MNCKVSLKKPMLKGLLNMFSGWGFEKDVFFRENSAWDVAWKKAYNWEQEKTWEVEENKFKVHSEALQRKTNDCIGTQSSIELTSLLLSFIPSGSLSLAEPVLLPHINNRII